MQQPCCFNPSVATKMSGSIVDAASRSPSGVATLLVDLDNFLRTVLAVKRQHHLTSEELLILLALGRLGISVSAIGTAVRPVKCSDLSRWMRIPKETVRRKLSRLVDCGFAKMTSHGIILEDIDAWASIVNSILR